MIAVGNSCNAVLYNCPHLSALQDSVGVSTDTVSTVGLLNGCTIIDIVSTETRAYNQECLVVG